MISTTIRMGAAMAFLLGAASLSGCMGPTYGTGKSQGETLFDDLNNMVSLGGSSDAQPVSYSPRSELVTPENTKVLPAPQAARADSSGVESPEQRSARIQAEAYQGDGPIPADVATSRKANVPDGYLDRTRGDGSSFMRRRERDIEEPLSPTELRSRGELIRERITQRYQGSPQNRRFLSEPPTTYRKPAESAPIGDPGVDEEVKARRLRGNSSSLGSKISDLLPW
ncbi:hypothetical protein [Fulvimarina manganoxydans]|nr:hypothetical protein [Fulvimarina manganoxydans]